ncbi:MAG: twin-arginine translocase TatA/TatE family subunit [Bacteroidia bacterium]|nr:twin-arginine translocase TatA/TatE family subunit [Bacteroidia bacterium]
MDFLTMFLFFNLGGPEMIFIMLAILLLFGAKKIPELARGLGRGIREFRDATKEVHEQLEEGSRDKDEVKSKVK